MLDAPSTPAVAMFVDEDELRSSQLGEERCRAGCVDGEFDVDVRRWCPDPGVVGAKECVCRGVVAFPSSASFARWLG
jgi:hypothetical protein